MLAAAIAAAVVLAPGAADWRERAVREFMRAGFSGGSQRLIRWESGIRLWIGGQPTREDLQETAKIFQILAQIPGVPEIEMAENETEANFTVSFLPLDRLAQALIEYEAGNWAYASYRAAEGRIVEAKVAVACDVTTQRQRNHLLREEAVHAMGLTGHVKETEDSILYGPWTETETLAYLDVCMLACLYDRGLYPDMGQAAAEQPAREFFSRIFLDGSGGKRIQ